MTNYMKMKQITTKDIQSKKLELLRVFQDYCKENGLPFFMAYGSLIGCIREHGYIPWDEDIDLYMMRDDFNKLLKASSDVLGKMYFIQSYKTDKYFYVPMLRLCINGTYRCEKGLEKGKFNKGTFIDVFPLDSVPNDERLREKHYKAVKRYASLLRLKTSVIGLSNIKSILMACVKLLLSPISFTCLQKLAMKKMQKYSKIDSDYVISISTVYGSKKESFKKEWFRETVYKDFDTLSVPCPCGYDELLSQIYGDYMQRPAEGNRKIDCPSYYIE